MIFGQERRRVVANELFVFTEEFWVFIGLAKGLLENLYAFLGCSRRKNDGGAGNPESAPQNDQFTLAIRPGKALKLGKLA